MAAGPHRMDCCAEECAPDCVSLCPATIVQAPFGKHTPEGPSAKLLEAWQAQTLKEGFPLGPDPPPRTIFI